MRSSPHFTINICIFIEKKGGLLRWGDCAKQEKRRWICFPARPKRSRQAGSFFFFFYFFVYKKEENIEEVKQALGERRAELNHLVCLTVFNFSLLRLLFKVSPAQVKCRVSLDANEYFLPSEAAPAPLSPPSSPPPSSTFSIEKEEDAKQPLSHIYIWRLAASLGGRAATLGGERMKNGPSIFSAFYSPSSTFSIEKEEDA